MPLESSLRTVDHPPAAPASSTGGSSPSPQSQAAPPRELVLISPLSPAEILARLDIAARRGRLPGFEKIANPTPTPTPTSTGLFTIELHGKPFDGILTAAPLPPAAAPTRLRLTARMLPQMPAIFAAVLISTVWPGIYFMDRLIPGWSWIPQFGAWWPQTWWWYLPLTILPLPFAWRTLMRRSRAALDLAMRESAQKLAKEIDGRLEGDEAASA